MLWVCTKNIISYIVSYKPCKGCIILVNRAGYTKFKGYWWNNSKAYFLHNIVKIGFQLIKTNFWDICYENKGCFSSKRFKITFHAFISTQNKRFGQNRLSGFDIRARHRHLTKINTYGLRVPDFKGPLEQLIMKSRQTEWWSVFLVCLMSRTNWESTVG